MSNQDPYKSDINYHTGQFHTSSEKIAAGVHSGDSEWSAAEKLRNYNNPNGSSYGQTSAAGNLFAVLIIGFFYTIKNTIGPFKKATRINAFLYLGIAVFLYGLAFYTQGFPRKEIMATSDPEDLSSYSYDGFLSLMTPDMDFFGRPNRYIDKYSPHSARNDVIEIYKGILTENEINKLSSDVKYNDPPISAMRAIAVKKGLADQFDQRTIDYLNDTYKKDPQYKNSNFVITKETRKSSTYDKRKKERICAL